MGRDKTLSEPSAQKPQEAQQRVDRIQAFWEEMQALEQEQVLTLPEEQRHALRTHHDQLLKSFSRQFQVDTTRVQKQLSLGMRIVSLLGALAFAAALFFFIYHIWYDLSNAARIIILTAAPLMATMAVDVVAHREIIRYFSPILGLLAFTAFGLNLFFLRALFNLTPSALGLLALAIFALILAYTYNLRFLLIAGILAFLAYLSASVGAVRGVYWLSLGQRPEDFVIAGPFIALISLVPHPGYPEFPRVYRVCGLLAFFLAMLVLAHGGCSYLPLPAKTIEEGYQVAGFVVSAGVIWLGVRTGLRDLVIVGNIFFLVFFYTRFFAWFWDWLPAYLFFFILGVITLLILFYLKWLRRLTLRSPS
jgi:predicted membrane protein DUF2157